VLNHKFLAKESLAAVRLFIEMNRKDGGGPFNLRQNFPPKVYADEDYEKPLDQLGIFKLIKIISIELKLKMIA